MTLVSIVLTWASVALQARIYLRHTSGQSPKGLPTLTNGESSSAA